MMTEEEMSRNVVFASGEIDMATAPELSKSIKKAYHHGAKEICVDLSDVSFMDSSGIRVLIESAQLLADEQGSLTIRNPRPPVRRILELSGILDMVISEEISDQVK